MTDVKRTDIDVDKESINNESVVDNNNNKSNENIINHKDVVEIESTTDTVDEGDLNYDIQVKEDNFMLTTIDNPFNPKTDYDNWKQWDQDHGYNTEEYIARLIVMDGNYEIEDEFAMNLITRDVIDDILMNDTLNIYRLV